MDHTQPYLVSDDTNMDDWSNWVLGEGGAFVENFMDAADVRTQDRAAFDHTSVAPQLGDAAHSVSGPSFAPVYFDPCTPILFPMDSGFEVGDTPHTEAANNAPMFLPRDQYTSRPSVPDTTEQNSVETGSHGVYVPPRPETRVDEQFRCQHIHQGTQGSPPGDGVPVFAAIYEARTASRPQHHASEYLISSIELLPGPTNSLSHMEPSMSTYNLDESWSTWNPRNDRNRPRSLSLERMDVVDYANMSSLPLILSRIEGDKSSVPDSDPAMSRTTFNNEVDSMMNSGLTVREGMIEAQYMRHAGPNEYHPVRVPPSSIPSNSCARAATFQILVREGTPIQSTKTEDQIQETGSFV